jgi:MerR family transcriptional regulator/heat shock protein HspR
VVGALVSWPDSDRGVFAISVAADLAGLHPQTLRIYEREGLLQPDRSDGGTRRYSGADVERLRLIAALTTSGLNLAGVKRVLALETELVEMRATIERLDAKVEDQRKQLRNR